MRVNLEDGSCRSCGGQLAIVDFDDGTMTVLCTNPECGDGYDLETDGFDDGGVPYYFHLQRKRLEEDDG